MHQSEKQPNERLLKITNHLTSQSHATPSGSASLQETASVFAHGN
jgi:hypothetical protein